MYRVAIFLVCVGATTSTTALAHICWIDHVKAERAGVRVFFGSSAYGHGGRAHGEEFYIDDSGIHLGAATKPVRGSFLAPGDFVERPGESMSRYKVDSPIHPCGEHRSCGFRA